ncbi:hypothetical protein WJ21_04555 [Burkholderia vietnamiensis]|uniref:hypothetical protein n=1 Tax=Burkholderia vietnamiensis TaxID=60552 RepID=UPI00075DACDC|nr:hypothetical protein WJ21_04555 [Burkholderia vietnamiensis]
MRELPILFSGPMVRAILEGRKTQTRRVVKLPHNNQLGAWEPTTAGGGSVKYAGGTPAPELAAIWHTRTGDCYVCPHGDVGDRLWVRETHLAWWKLDEANPAGPRVFSHVAAYAADGYELEPGEKWIPSIHMLRAASRITLEITDVRAERLQSISESDARAEGVTIEEHHMRGYCAGACRPPSIRAFHDLWDGLNASRGHGWEANPWVWAVEFRKVES